MSKKVLVLNPPAGNLRFSRDGRCQSDESTWLDTFPPTTLASVAGTVREKHKVLLLDCIGSRLSYKGCIARASSFKPDFTILNTATPTIASDLEIAAAIKESTGSKIIAYGVHITACSKAVLKDFPQIDFAVLGEPETPVMSILSGKPKVRGVAMPGFNGGIWQEPNLDALPFPAYDLLPSYTYPLTDEKWMFVRSGRGCPFSCSYCVMPLMSGRKLRYHSPDYMVNQMKWLAKKLNTRLFMFWDELATFNKERMLELCEKIVRDGLHRECRWFCTTRVDCFDVELAKGMRRAGCRMISFGFESGSQSVLDRNGKGTRVGQAARAVAAAKGQGLKTIGHFIIGLPGSSPETARATIELSKKLKLNFAQFYVATPFPGSEFYREAVKNKWFVSEDWSKVEQGTAVVSYPNFSAEQIRKWKSRAYMSFYLRPYAVYSLLSSVSVRKLLSLPLAALKFLAWARK